MGAGLTTAAADLRKTGTVPGHRQPPKPAIGLIPEFQRIWRYYLLACAGLFRSRRGQLRQIVLSKCSRCQIYRSVPSRACQLTNHGPKLVSNLLATEHDLSGVFETTDAMK